MLPENGRNKMKNKLKLFVMAILVMAMVCSACSGSEPAPAASTEEKSEAAVSSIPEKETEAPATEAPTTEAPTTEAPTTEAPTTEAPTTEAPTTEAPATEAPSEAETTRAAVDKTVSHSFDPATNKTYTAKGIEFQIPVDWSHADPYFYPCREADNFAMIYYMAVGTADASMLDNAAFVDSYAKGLTSSLTNGKVIDSQIMEIGGRKMLVVDLEGEINSLDMELRFATMEAPEDGKLLVFGFGQRINGTTDYSEDFMSILENLKDVKN